MTDRHRGYLITLRQDLREDDSEAVMQALHMIKGVLTVEPLTATSAEQVAGIRRDEAWQASLYRLIKNGPAT